MTQKETSQNYGAFYVQNIERRDAKNYSAFLFTSSVRLPGWLAQLQTGSAGLQ